MGPELMLAATVASTAVGAAGSIMKGQAEADGLKTQAAFDQQRAKTNEELAHRRALEERAAAQQGAADEMRQTRLAQSRLGAVAGASGSGASDPTVMKLWEDIEGQGRSNADRITAGGDQKAQSITYQAQLDRWGADKSAAMKRAAAKQTLIGGYMGAFGSVARGAMGMRYGGNRAPSARSEYEPA